MHRWIVYSKIKNMHLENWYSDFTFQTDFNVCLRDAFALRASTDTLSVSVRPEPIAEKSCPECLCVSLSSPSGAPADKHHTHSTKTLIWVWTAGSCQTNAPSAPGIQFSITHTHTEIRIVCNTNPWSLWSLTRSLINTPRVKREAWRVSVGVDGLIWRSKIRLLIRWTA